RPMRWMLVFIAVCGFAVFMFSRLPGGFLPSEDQGFFFVSYTGAPGGTAERTEVAVKQAEAVLQQESAVRNVASVVGFSFFGQGQTAALSFVDMYPWAQRPGAANSVDALVGRSNLSFLSIPEARIFAL